MVIKKKLISIIINCHNGEKYLVKTLKSVLNQKYQNFEVIFLDNCSTDRSSIIFKKINDKRFKYFKTKSKIKLYAARNLALRKCKGELISFLDTDDWWDKEYLSSKEKFFENENYDYFYSNVFFYYEKNKKLKRYKDFNLPSGIIFENLAIDYFIIISGLIIKKKILEKDIYFNKDYNIIGDYDLLMKISRYANAKAFNKPLVYYRVHEKNFSKLNSRDYFFEYDDWFKRQLKSSDIKFQRNKNTFQLKLFKLEIIYLLYEKKTLSLLIKIMRYPQFLSKFKFLLAFFLPLKLVNFFRK